MGQIGNFGDFMLATRPKLVTDTKTLYNQSTKYRTYLVRTMLNGLSNKRAFQSGTELVDRIKLSNTSTYLDYEPTQDFDFTGTDGLTEIKMPWRHSLVYSVWYDHEIELNQGDERTVYKNLREKKNGDMEQSWWEGSEDALWATPDEAEMETGGNTSGKKPYSLRCFVTDDGLAPSSTNGGVTGSGGDWTNVMQVNPSTETNWRNQVRTYSAASIDSTLLPALDLLWLDIQFESPENSQQYMSDTRINKLKFLVSKLGYAKLIDLATRRNDTLTPRGDIGYLNGKVQYHSIPFQYIGALDTVDATDDALGEYRIRAFNFNHIYPIYHTKRYMHPINPPISSTQPFAHVMIRDTWRNIWCFCRREQGIVRAA